ncbi:nicotinamidase-related amidase [Halomonas campaniensis]|uniref:Nicotinamidase-related amidase n=1 Tax=Halomonas campaniensis TaxID=213554 RepID=A0A7W5PCL4_9GAMM|nr:cysteine hydrolase [Halomonas campaniensis]MBB3332722.1 nicotinamidase-related amidase [Halomonas campaniensis]
MCDHKAHSTAAEPTFHAVDKDRRRLLAGGLAGITAATLGGLSSRAEAAEHAGDPYAPPEKAALPSGGFKLDLARAALVVTDPQIDFLSPDGVTWEVVGESVQEHGTVENIRRLFAAAKQSGITVAVSPHYYYPHDHRWQFNGPLEKLMHNIGMFDRPDPLAALERGSGADFMPEYREFIEDGKTIITSPHKVYGPEQNDLVLQLRKQRVDQVILAGMSANLCVEAHMRELLEQGFEVVVVRDATAAAKLPEGDGYLAALTNFRYMANALWSTEETVARLQA